MMETFYGWMMVIGLFIAFGIVFNYVDRQDMKVCELSHSRDVCFATLNR